MNIAPGLGNTTDSALPLTVPALAPVNCNSGRITNKSVHPGRQPTTRGVR
jgi:hypothetical protein